MGKKVVYWCANCKHIIPDYLRERTVCEYCGGDTVKIIEENKDIMSSREIIEDFIASGEKERK